MGGVKGLDGLVHSMRGVIDFTYMSLIWCLDMVLLSMTLLTGIVGDECNRVSWKWGDGEQQTTNPRFTPQVGNFPSLIKDRTASSLAVLFNNNAYIASAW